MRTKLLLLSRVFFVLIFSVFFYGKAEAQCPACSALTVNVNLSSVTDTAWTFSATRSGDCCTGTNCIRFNVTLNPASDLLSFDVTNPSPSGSAFYQINCGPMISIGT
ncbi:MAG TPA: hypothetical protein VFJ43_14335, partial [Bacteroidia bacterium]|nr:hypothetical protein [Bacteroidia bacterium]